MLRRAAGVLEIALPVAVALLLLLRLGLVWAVRVPYPYDLEWMEGGMLAHAWRLANGLPIYVEPGPDFVPYVYPPGYAALVAALGGIFGLHPALGRVVALSGALAAAGAIGAIVRRHGGSPVVAACAAVAFLGAYPNSGAFYDLVRPDGLFVGALLWSVALALDGRKGTPLAAGLLLAVAFLMKHNAAAFGIPLVLGLLARDGWRSALAFTLASAAPAGAMVGLLQWRSSGRFLTYLLEVPASHPSYLGRIWPDTFRELGTALPLALGVPVVWLLVRAMDGQRAVPRAVSAFLPVAAGTAAGWWGTYLPPAPDSALYTVPSSVAFFAAAAVPAALLVLGIGRWLDGARPVASWRLVAGVGLVGTAFLVAAAMRAHNGGFLNVHVPMFAIACVAYGLALSRWALAGTAGRVVVTAALALQGLWSMAMLHPERLSPTEADRAAGARIVELIRAAEGPVLSPFAAWLPVYAGKEPSLHYMALWDLEYEGGPYRADTERVGEALAARRWTLILAGNRRFPYPLDEHYAEREVLLQEKDRSLMPKTGWRARPTRALVPK